MQCILGFKGSFPCVKRDKTAAWGEREREERREREGMSIRSNKEHFLYSAAWHHLSTLADAEWMLRTRHPSGEGESAFWICFSADDLSLGEVCARTQRRTRTHKHYKDTKVAETGVCLFINPRVICEQLLTPSFTTESIYSLVYGLRSLTHSLTSSHPRGFFSVSH